MSLRVVERFQHLIEWNAIERPVFLSVVEDKDVIGGEGKHGKEIITRLPAGKSNRGFSMGRKCLYTKVNSMRRKKKGRGFKSLTDAERQLVASMGGKAAHAKGKRHVFTHDEAQAAGRKGGVAPHKTRGRYRTMGKI